MKALLKQQIRLSYSPKWSDLAQTRAAKSDPLVPQPRGQPVLIKVKIYLPPQSNQLGLNTVIHLQLSNPL